MKSTLSGNGNPTYLNNRPLEPCTRLILRLVWRK